MNNKRKGNKFERELCKILTYYYNPNSNLIFIRDASSGRYLNKANKCIGDLFCLLENFPNNILIEAKYYSNFNFKSNLIEKFLEQYKDYNDYIIYIFIKSKIGLFVLTNKKFHIYPYYCYNENFTIYDFNKIKNQITFEQFFNME